MYAIIDVETTGGSPKRERIIEIAIIKSDGEKVIDSYQTLVNPEKTIPPFVCNLTGISNEMVEQAPVFDEVASKIDDFTKGCVIVAHNAHFDYGFIKNEFRYIGRYYQRDRICTVKLTQRALPGLEGYSLGKLSEHFKIKHDNKHRAYGDADATAKLLHILLRDANPEILAQFMHKGYIHRPPQVKIPEKQIVSVPDETGVLSFHDKSGKILYVMKSNDLYTRITDMLFYFNPDTHKGNMMQKVSDISYVKTGSEILSQILEIEYIYKNKPAYNKKTYGLNLVELQTAKNKYGYFVISFAQSKKITKEGVYFSNFYEANSQVANLLKIHKLCPNLCGRKAKMNGVCDFYQNKLCMGACSNQEDTKTYNRRVERALRKLKYKIKNFMLVDEGPEITNNTLFVIVENKCVGYTIRDQSETIENPRDILDELKPIIKHPIIDQKIRMFISKKKYKEIIPFK